MKTTIRVVTIIGLLLLIAGCKPSHRVDFKPALISIDPGEGWKRLDLYNEPPACTPSLMGKAGMINALLLEDFTDNKKAADHLQSSYASNGKALPDTFKQEDFTTDGKESGVHLSYTGKTAKSATPDLRSHNFITRNRRGQCVSVSYITSPELESAAVIEAICKSLRVE